MPVPGVSTVGVKFGYAAETAAGTQPTAFTLLNRINQIGGITIEQEQIDASALEDAFEKSIAGRGSTGGSFPVTVNVTPETIAEWEGVISAYNTAKAANKQMWFNTYVEALGKSYMVVAEPPLKLPQPDFDQNSLLTMEITLIINDYKGIVEGVAPAAATTTTNP